VGHARRQAAGAARRIRQHEQLERCVPARHRRARARDRHGHEDRRNETQFPEFFVAAFGDNAADRDRNGHVSIAEAFEYAKAKVVQAFQQKGLLLTEHATMDDGSEGRLAATMFLGIGRAESTLAVDTSDPAMKKLVDEKEAIDQQIAALKLKKGAIDEGQYDAQMEKLLTDLALKTRAIRDLQAQAKKDRP